MLLQSDTTVIPKESDSILWKEKQTSISWKSMLCKIIILKISSGRQERLKGIVNQYLLETLSTVKA